MTFHRDTWAEINLDAIAWNVSKMKDFLGEKVDIMAVVKANAYGHGDIQVAETAIEAGATSLAVAILDEAIALRNKGIQIPILVLGATRPEDAAIAARYHISLTIFHKDWLKKAETVLQNQPLHVHIKTDTGMGRLGIREYEELKEVITYCTQSNHFVWEGLFTHFATADQLDESYFNKQLSTFGAWVDQLDEKPSMIHSSNSAAGMKLNINQYSAVRLGISMYGLSPSPEVKSQIPFPLKPALSLHTKIVQMKKVEKGTAISYGNTYVSEEDEWIATLPIGYADGWIRRLQGQEVLINGERAPIVGRICMDQCMIRLSKFYPEGTKVSLICEEIPIDEIAERLETINYEVACMISSRIPRIYFKNQRLFAVKNVILGES